MNTETKISQRKLANRAAKRAAETKTRAAQIMLAAVAAAASRPLISEEQFVTDYAGRKVRTTPASREEVAHFLRGNRVVDQVEILEQVGEAAFNNMYNNGSIVRDASFNRYHKNNLYWITTKAAEVYGIPARVTLASGATVALIEG